MERMAKMEEDYRGLRQEYTGPRQRRHRGAHERRLPRLKKACGLYRAITTILRGPIGITDLEYDILKETLKRHMIIETKMIEEAKILMDEEGYERVKFLLRARSPHSPN